MEKLAPEHLRATMVAYRDLLRRHRERLNRLNVSPEPDGDTGTNMFLTMSAAREALQQAVTERPDDRDAALDRYKRTREKLKQLLIDGQPAGELWGAVAWDGPVTREDPDDVRAFVQIDIPREGAVITGPLTVPNTGGWQSWTTVRKRKSSSTPSIPATSFAFGLARRCRSTALFSKAALRSTSRC